MEWQTRIEDKLDKIVTKIEAINMTLIKQEENIKEHMRRTKIAENNIEELKKEAKSVQLHVFKMKLLGKLITYIGFTVSVAAGVFEILNFIK